MSDFAVKQIIPALGWVALYAYAWCDSPRPRRPPLVLRSIRTHKGDSLTGASRNWPTPDANAIDDGDTPETFEARRQGMIAKGYNGNGAGLPLAMAAKLWPTPDADLNVQTSLWQAPSVADATGGHISRGHERKGELLLRGQAKQWSTPQAYSYDESHAPGQTTLDTQSRSFLPPTKGASASGPPSSQSDPTLHPRLNVRFSEWLMGIPPGWTDVERELEPIDFEQWATELSRCRRLLLSSF